MSVLSDLVSQIDDKVLRERISEEVGRLTKQKKFGLVFEEHLPECTPLYDVPVRRGSLVSIKSKEIKDLYRVQKIEGNTAHCIRKGDSVAVDYSINEIVSVAEFGDSIYPYLKPIDSVCNAPDSDLWHTLIEADNYHALQLLEYLYAGKVDCIYIDPPYNTGAKDWKYNNDYVDSADAYRHSKWLSFMEKRLRIAKKLLNPKDSVLIVTIDEKEYLHLGCLLEELFPEAKIQMVSSLINYTATARSNQFDRVNELIFFVMFGDYSIFPLDDSKNFKSGQEVNWRSLRRQNSANTRDKTNTQFYPIYVNNITHTIEEIGIPIKKNASINDIPKIKDCTAVFPIRDNGKEMMWGLTRETLIERLSKGYVRVNRYVPQKKQPYILSFLETGTIAGIENGDIEILDRRNDNSVIAVYKTQRKIMPKTQWDYKSHDARSYGTYLTDSIIGDKRFAYPKSLYAVRDCIKLFVANKPNALILDFFSGSGTTAHAVNLLNAEDGGHRRCIMVTNNEVSDAEAKALSKQGYRPGDEEWEELGIAHYVTWPRTVCSIEGRDVNDNKLKGKYLDSGIPMSDGFESNCEFFKLGFLDKDEVALGKQFKEMIPLLWMKAGAIGKRPEIEDDSIPDMMVLPDNKFAVLTNDKSFIDFENAVMEHPEIKTIFIVTDSDSGYRDMISGFEDRDTYQLYRDYLDNFRINSNRR